MSAFVNHTYADLFRNLLTPAQYLCCFSADSEFYLFRLRTQDQNIIPTARHFDALRSMPPFVRGLEA